MLVFASARSNDASPRSHVSQLYMSCFLHSSRFSMSQCHMRLLKKWSLLWVQERSYGTLYHFLGKSVSPRFGYTRCLQRRHVNCSVVHEKWLLPKINENAGCECPRLKLHTHPTQISVQSTSRSFLHFNLASYHRFGSKRVNFRSQEDKMK